MAGGEKKIDGNEQSLGPGFDSPDGRSTPVKRADKVGHFAAAANSGACLVR